MNFPVVNLKWKVACENVLSWPGKKSVKSGRTLCIVLSGERIELLRQNKKKIQLEKKENSYDSCLSNHVVSSDLEVYMTP